MKRPWIALIALASSLAVAAPMGWQSFTDKKGLCRFQVPATWKKSATLFATAPDNTARASAVSCAYTRAMIEQATAGFKKQTLEQDTRHVLYRIEVTGALAGFATLEYYEAIFAGTKGCIVRANTSAENPEPFEAVLKQIASSARWQP